MALSRARLKRMERSLRPVKTYLTLAECIGEAYQYGHLLPGHELHAGARPLINIMLARIYLRAALEVHQATPEDLAVLGLEGRKESRLSVDELAWLLNHKLGRPLETTINGEELKAIGRERYLPAESNSDEKAWPDKERPYKPGFPRSIFQGTE